MPKLSSMKIGGRYKALWIGKSGARKTSSLAAMPKPMYIFDFDNRLDPLLLRLNKQEQEEVEFDSYSVGSIGKAQDKMTSILRSNPYRTIAFDSLTSIGDVAIYESRASKGFGKGRVVAKVMLPDIEDYGMESGFMMAVLDFMKKVECHAILTAHLLKIEENDVDSGVIGRKRISYSLLSAGKKVAAKLPGYFNEVMYFQKDVGFEAGSEVVKVFTRAVNIGDGAVDAKSALPLPPVIDITTESLWPQICKAVEEHGTSMNIPEPEKDPTADLPVAGGF